MTLDVLFNEFEINDSSSTLRLHEGEIIRTDSLNSLDLLHCIVDESLQVIDVLHVVGQIQHCQCLVYTFGNF